MLTPDINLIEFGTFRSFLSDVISNKDLIDNLTFTSKWTLNTIRSFFPWFLCMDNINI